MKDPRPVLPADVARCFGKPGSIECDDCRRRTDPPDQWRQVYITAPDKDEEPCPLRIEP